MNCVAWQRLWQPAIVRKQCHLAWFSFLFVKGFDGSQPRCFLCVVDLAQIQYLALTNSPVTRTATLYDIPVVVLLAVPFSTRRLQVHAAIFVILKLLQEGRSSPQAFFKFASLFFSHLQSFLSQILLFSSPSSGIRVRTLPLYKSHMRNHRSSNNSPGSE